MVKWGKVDYKQLQKMQKSLEKLDRIDRVTFNEQVVKELAARMLAKVIKRTPVGVYPEGSGKTGGTLRRGWTIGPVVHMGDMYEIEVIDPVEYAAYVEFGHRTANHSGWVPGRFMMTVSENELERDAPRIIEKKLIKLLGGAFNDS